MSPFIGLPHAMFSVWKSGNSLLNNSFRVNKSIPVLFWNASGQRPIRNQQFCIVRAFFIAIDLSPFMITIKERSHLAHFVCNSETWGEWRWDRMLAFVKTDLSVNPHETRCLWTLQTQHGGFIEEQRSACLARPGRDCSGSLQPAELTGQP